MVLTVLLIDVLNQMGRVKADRAKEIISISLTKCVSSTYQMIFYNCREMYCKEFEDKNDDDDDGEGCSDKNSCFNMESVNDFSRSDESDSSGSYNDDGYDRYENKQKKSKKTFDKTGEAKPSLPTLTVTSPPSNNDDNIDNIGNM